MSMKRAFTLIFMGALSCGDPVHSDAVDALGPDVTTPGPTHRAGQPCIVCHGGLGPASKEFSFAGTLYKEKSSKDALEGATVQVTDAKNTKGIAKSNSVGNFYIEPFTPVLPARVEIAGPDGTIVPMQTHIGHDGSCASCHVEAPSPRSPGHVFLVDPSL